MKLFRPRSVERDGSSDADRRRRIVQFLGDMLDEIEAEKAGLLKRYSSAQGSASSLLHVLDGGEESGGFDERLTELENAMMYCERRVREIGTLSQQVGSLRQQVLQAAIEAAETRDDRLNGPALR